MTVYVQLLLAASVEPHDVVKEKLYGLGPATLALIDWSVVEPLLVSLLVSVPDDPTDTVP